MAAGPLLFARYAYPPNELGYCGGDDHRALLEQASSGLVDGAFGRACGNSRAPGRTSNSVPPQRPGRPTRPEGVEAYWLGSKLLERVGPALFAES
jgi:hypothetical protein